MLHGNIDPCDWRSMLVDHEIDDPRPIKVICIGAGISGIITGIRLPHHIKNLELVIYEKNHDVGGTWLENTCVHPQPTMNYPVLGCSN
jgi:cation diffusion facilitator CzcD-associated flavoprotein CzcO